MDRIQQVLSHDLLSTLPLQDDDNNDDADVFGFVGRDQSTMKSSPAIGTVFNQGSAQNSTDWAPLQSPRSLAAMSTLPLPEATAALNRSRFQSAFDNLSDQVGDQVWRSDIFMQEQGNQHPGIEAANWSRAVQVGARVGGNGVNIAERSTSHGLMVSQADGTQLYGSGCPHSFGSTTAATTSSSNGSSQGENPSSSARPACAATSSPDQLHQQYHLHALSPAPISGSSVPDRTSSSVRLAHNPHQLEAELAYPKQPTNSGPRSSSSALNHPNLRRTTSCSDRYEIQKALSLFEAQEIQSDQWRQLQASAGLQLNPPSTSNLQQHEFSFDHSWQQDVDDPAIATAAQRLMVNTNSSSCQTDLMGSNMNSNSRLKQVAKIPSNPLLRRHTLSAMEVLKEVETYHQDIQAADQAASNICDELHQGFRSFDQSAHVEINAPRTRGRPRMTGSGSNGPTVLHGSHTEAAMNHMLAERRRRVKQKENFATLRRLVPIISKADKASTLVDAIAYLKDLENTIVHMEANKEDMDQHCENLAHKCMELEEQNKELVAILSKGTLDSTCSFNHLKLQSMKSI